MKSITRSGEKDKKPHAGAPIKKVKTNKREKKQVKKKLSGRTAQLMDGKGR